MRTKKILSILLVMLMTMGVFGVMGASAVVLVGEVGEEVAVQADKGWDAVPNPFPIYDESLLKAKKMEDAVVTWVPFANEDGNATAAGSFYKLYTTHIAGSPTNQAVVEWKAYKVNTDELNTDEVEEPNPWASNRPYDVRTNNSYGTGAYFNVSASEVTLYLYQGDVKYYGWVRVELSVKVDTNEDGVVDSEKVATPIWVHLADPTNLAKKINEAKEQAAKTDRYTKVYLDNLNLRIKNASELLTQKASAELVAYHMDLLDKAIKGIKPDGTSVGNIWRLTSDNGDNWIDGFLKQKFIAFWWQMSDVFAVIKKVADPLFGFLGQIGNFFGNLMPIFGLFTGLLGL